MKKPGATWIVISAFISAPVLAANRPQTSEPSSSSALGQAGYAAMQTQPRKAATPESIRPSTQMKEYSQADAELLAQLHDINQKEIQLGMLAATHGGTQPVKNYGNMLENDHQKADKKVKALAEGLGINLTDALPKTQQWLDHERKDADTLAKLQALQGVAFDSPFLSAMVSGHEEAISLVETTRPSLVSNDVRKLVDHLLPTLQHHRDEAAKLLQNPGAPWRAERRSPRPQGG